MKRKFLTVTLLASVLALLLSGCAGRVQQGAEGDPEHAHLTYGLWDVAGADVLHKLTNAYHQQHPGVTVDVQTTPNSQYWTKLRTEATSGTAPDIATMNGPNLPLYASFGQLEPVDDLMGPGKMDPTKYPKTLVDMYTYNGHHYGVPKDFDVSALAYNKRLFDLAGEPYPSNDWTWADMQAAAKRLQAKLGKQGDYGFIAPLAGQGGYWDTMYQAGGSPLKDGKPNYESQASQAGVAYLKSFLDDGTSPTAAQLTDTQPLDWMISGKGAMDYVASYELVELKGSKDAENFGFVKMPKGVDRAAVIHGLSNVVMKSSKNKAAAKQFVQWLAGKDAQDVWANAQDVIPAYEGAAETWAKSLAPWDLSAYISTARQDARPYPTTLTTSAWAKTTDSKLQDYFANGGSLAKVTQACDADIQRSLNDDQKLLKTK